MWLNTQGTMLWNFIRYRILEGKNIIFKHRNYGHIYDWNSEGFFGGSSPVRLQLWQSPPRLEYRKDIWKASKAK